MPYNVVEASRAATQSGLALGAQMFNNSLRMQQLKSQQELQQLEMRQRAEALRWMTMQHQQAIQQQADTAKATAAFVARTTPTIPMPPGVEGPPEVNPLYQPNVGQAFMESFMPLAKTPEDASKIMLDAATMQLRQAQAVDEQAMAASRGQPRQLTPQDIALKEAQTRLARARTDQVQKGAAYAPTDTIKNLTALADAEAKKDQNAIIALRRQLKLDGLSETEMVKFRSELHALDNNILMDATEKEQRREAIYEKYDRVASSKRVDEANVTPTLQPGATTPFMDTSVKLRPTNQVTRVLRDGRRAIFDANTKQFLRYAD